jgi:hypothetical protein
MSKLPSFLSALPSCPPTFTAAPDLTIHVSPLWLKPVYAEKMSSLPRCEIEELIKRKKIKAAWRRTKSGRLLPLIYAPSLWNYLHSLAEPALAQAAEKGAR